LNILKNILIRQLIDKLNTNIMKYDDIGNETSKLIKNKQKETITLRNEDYPLLNSKFMTFLQIVNIATTAYIIVSSCFYFIVHYYGKRIIKSKNTSFGRLNIE
jgi:hypothetical protein